LPGYLAPPLVALPPFKIIMSRPLVPDIPRAIPRERNEPPHPA